VKLAYFLLVEIGRIITGSLDVGGMKLLVGLGVLIEFS
jgi:hypothetical protein